jgi:ArsR family transcriptional regulator
MFTLDRTLRALGDETRLRILNLLSRGQLPVADLIAAMDAPQARISQQLARLRSAGLVEDRRQGKSVYYSLCKPRSRVQAKILGCVRECCGELAVYRRDLWRLKNLRPRLKPVGSQKGGLAGL